MKTFAICILCLTLVVGTALAGKPGGGAKPQGLVITQTIDDFDNNSVPYSIQSDGTGDYIDGLAGGISGDASVLMSGVCNGLTYGDRLLDLQMAQARKVRITLENSNALQVGDTGYVVAANPIGTVSNSVRMLNTCTCGSNLSMYEMGPGSKIYCDMHLRLSPMDNTSNYYRLDMGTPGEEETEEVQISCNASGSDGKCSDWDINPISDPDYSTANPGLTRARLVLAKTERGKTTLTNQGAFYMRFHIHVTRP